MNCPNCGAERLLTTETFQTGEATIRTKKCRECEWTFTSHETISDQLVIRKELRDKKAHRHETKKR